jgi:hypothetical protein
MMDTRELILLTVEDLAEDLLGMDRQEDAELPSGAIEEAVATGKVSISEIVLYFELKLRSIIPVPVDEPGSHVGQAGHTVRSKRIQAQVAEMER